MAFPGVRSIFNLRYSYRRAQTRPSLRRPSSIGTRGPNLHAATKRGRGETENKKTQGARGHRVIRFSAALQRYPVQLPTYLSTCRWNRWRCTSVSPVLQLSSRTSGHPAKCLSELSPGESEGASCLTVVQIHSSSYGPTPSRTLLSSILQALKRCVRRSVTGMLGGMLT